MGRGRPFPPRRRGAPRRGVERVPQGIRLDGRKILPLWSGTAHYWRLDPAHWGRVLDRLREMGLEIVETYVPWSVHETAEGAFDWGKSDERRDLPRFLDLAADRGMKVILRPGPHINAEMTDFGYPSRVLRIPEIQARTAWGTPALLPVPPRMFPAPSYASRRFEGEVARWFDAFAEVARGALHPRGPVVALQIDNEMSFFFRTDPFDLDYHPEAIASWCRFLEGEYGGAIERLNATHGTRWKRFDEADPPRAHDPKAPVAREIDWVRFKERFLVDRLARIRAMLEERGLSGVVFTHNYPASAQQSPFDVSRVEAGVADVQGVDLYLFAREAPYLKKTALYLAGTSRLPYAPEFGSGCALWLKPLTVEDHRLITPSLFLHGVKAVTFYMAVERERWFGSPIRSDGSIEPSAFSLHRDLLARLRKVRLWELDRRSDVLLLLSRRALRHQAIENAFSPLPPLLFDALGWGAEETCLEEGEVLPLPMEHERWWKGWMAALDGLRIPYALGDTEGNPSLWARYRLVVAPDFYPGEGEELERRFPKGPRLLRSGGIPSPRDLDEVARRSSVARLGEVLPGGCEASIFEGRGRRVLMIANPSTRATEARLARGISLTDPLTGERLTGVVRLEKGSVGIFEISGGSMG